MKVLVFGSAGQLGGTVMATPGHALVGLTRREVDVTDAAAVRDVAEAHRPDVLVNCTAYNNVDGAEDDARTALEVNASPYAAWRRPRGTWAPSFVHYSTDFVFDGDADTPYAETDRARPVGVYGCRSCSASGWRWMRLVPTCCASRASSAARSARSSVDRIVQALRDGRETPVFTDRVVSPSYVDDVVAATSTWWPAARRLVSITA